MAVAVTGTGMSWTATAVAAAVAACKWPLDGVGGWMLLHAARMRLVSHAVENAGFGFNSRRKWFSDRESTEEF
jgi:hypothetical protein